MSFFARFSNCLSLTSSFLEEDVFSTTFVAELAFVSLDFLEDDLALAVFFSFLSASAREIDSLAYFLDIDLLEALLADSASLFAESALYSGVSEYKNVDTTSTATEVNKYFLSGFLRQKYQIHTILANQIRESIVPIKLHSFLFPAFNDVSFWSNYYDRKSSNVYVITGST